MNKEYRYRKHIHWCQYIFPIFYGILIAGVWGVFGMVILTKKFPLILELVLPPAILSFILLSLGIFLWYLFYSMASIRVSFNDEGIVYKDRGGEKKIPFENIQCLKFPSIPYTGGWVKIISKERTIRLTLVFENIGGFLQELKASLDKRGLSDRYDRAKLFRFLKTAVCADQSWARAYKIFWKLVLITVFTITAGFILVILTKFPISRVSLGKAWIMLSALWPTIVYTAGEIVFARQIAKKSDEKSFTFPRRDTIYEKAVYQKTIFLGTLIYFGIALLIFVLLLFPK